MIYRERKIKCLWKSVLIFHVLIYHFIFSSNNLIEWCLIELCLSLSLSLIVTVIAWTCVWSRRVQRVRSRCGVLSWCVSAPYASSVRAMPWRPTTAAVETACRTSGTCPACASSQRNKVLQRCVTWMSLSSELTGRLHRHLVARGRGFENPPPRTANVHLILCFLSEPSKLFYEGRDWSEESWSTSYFLKPNSVRKISSTSVKLICVFCPTKPKHNHAFLNSTSKMHLHLFLIMPCILYYFSFHMYCIFICLNVNSACVCVCEFIYFQYGCVCVCFHVLCVFFIY